jgi:hypothetical protein
MWTRLPVLQHSATCCSAVQHAATQCTTLQRSTTCCNAVQPAAAPAHRRSSPPVARIVLAATPSTREKSISLYPRCAPGPGADAADKAIRGEARLSGGQLSAARISVQVRAQAAHPLQPRPPGPPRRRPCMHTSVTRRTTRRSRSPSRMRLRRRRPPRTRRPRTRRTLGAIRTVRALRGKQQIAI